MPDFLIAPFENGPHPNPAYIVIRLLFAGVLGGIVSLLYVRTSRGHGGTWNLPTTLVMLTILIAMVAQVVGDNVARAFSLVGALSVVRFRTIVRDTRDTAFVIFAVVVGMAIGARNPSLALIGIVVAGLAALAMKLLSPVTGRWDQQPFSLVVRVGLGHDAEKLAGATLDKHLALRDLVSINTARQGLAVDYGYHARLRAGGSPHALVGELHQLEGVQGVELRRTGDVSV